MDELYIFIIPIIGVFLWAGYFIFDESKKSNIKEKESANELEKIKKSSLDVTSPSGELKNKNDSEHQLFYYCLKQLETGVISLRKLYNQLVISIIAAFFFLLIILIAVLYFLYINDENISNFDIVAWGSVMSVICAATLTLALKTVSKDRDMSEQEMRAIQRTLLGVDVIEKMNGDDIKNEQYKIIINNILLNNINSVKEKTDGTTKKQN